jgi:CRISPR system Cascade subunit CasA
MNKFFNLLDERWLPVCMSDGSPREVGLLELFEKVEQVRSLTETSPPSLIAQYRLLLAITHRALSALPAGWKDGDRARWYRQGLPQDALRSYLEHWRDRFWLFHPENPFMQAASLETAEETSANLKPWTQVSLASSTGNAPVMFDHSFDSNATTVSPGLALRSLLGFLQFTPGGLVKVVRGSDKAGPLSNSAACIPTGDTLNQTLCLCLHPFLRGDLSDLPAWEMPSPLLSDLRADPTLARSVNDRYTRLSRAVLLRCNEDFRIEKIHFAAGVAMEEDPNAPDPMLSYRAGTNNLVRLSFRDGRALWRDLSALVPDAEGKAAHPAAVLGWAANLKSILEVEPVDQSILVAGIASDQAKLLRWRMEQIALPVPLLIDPGLAAYLREELRRTEEVYWNLRKIATRMLAESMPDPARKETADRARDIVDTGSSAATFFAMMERDLPRLIKLIAAAEFDTAQTLWSQSLLRAVVATWDLLRQGMGRSPSALRAEARAFPRFCALRRSLQPTNNSTDTFNEVQA